MLPSALHKLYRTNPHYHKHPPHHTASPSPLFEAFFYGRAFAQVLNERLGEVATDVLSEAGKFAAEWDDNVASFEQEVQQRAANAQAEALGQPVTAKTALLPKNVAGSTTRGSVTPTQQDVGAVVDALRADIAAARAALRQVKQSSSSNIS